MSSQRRSTYSARVATGTGSLREAQKALTRSRIIDAARVVFEKQGYAGASIGLIKSAHEQLAFGVFAK